MHLSLCVFCSWQIVDGCIVNKNPATGEVISKGETHFVFHFVIAAVLPLMFLFFLFQSQ